MTQHTQKNAITQGKIPPHTLKITNHTHYTQGITGELTLQPTLYYRQTRKGSLNLSI